MIRVASYNVHKGVGSDFRRAPDRALGIILRLDADVVALQEADRRFGRRPAAIPPERIDARLALEPVPVADGASDQGGGAGIGHHGNAILARPGMAAHPARPLDLPGFEPRGALIADIVTEHGSIRVAAAHLGLLKASRKGQVAELCEAAAAEAPGPLLVLGDFNEWRREAGHLLLPEGFEMIRPGPSFPARAPVAALDGMILGPGLKLRRCGVHDSPAARRASDHLPVWAEIERVG